MVTAKAPKPSLIQTAISLYEDEADQLDRVVELVRNLGAKFPSRTRVIRVALEQFLSGTPTAEIAALLNALPTQRK